jgi:hypothetical protein
VSLRATLFPPQAVAPAAKRHKHSPDCDKLRRHLLRRSVEKRVSERGSELETSRRHSLPVTVTVLNNQILGYQKHAEDVLFGAHTTAVDFQPVDHAAIARACGVNGVRVENPTDYAAALAEATAAPATTVIDAIVDPEAYPPISSFEGKLPLNPQRLEQSGA